MVSRPPAISSLLDSSFEGALAVLAAQRPEMKTLYISGYTTNVIVHGGILDAGVEYLPKPFNSAALARRVRSVLG